MDNGQIILFQTQGGETKIEVRLSNETVWLTADQMAELFQRDRSTIQRHIKRIYDEGELTADSTCAFFAQVQTEGTRQVERKIPTYNLDMIISVGYRVNSHRGVQFRQWATQVLKEYMIKGFVLNDELLKNAGQGNYFDELLSRIRDIRSSEKVFYRKVLEIYALSIDYDPRTESTQRFFKTVQNKMHFSAHGHTAAEVIFQRADAEKDFMGLTSWRGAMPTKHEAEIAKNYLTEEEVDMLNRIVNLYLDFAELQAKSHVPMYMKDWIKKLDDFLTLSGKELLTHAGTVSAEVAKLKADTEYDRFRERTQYQLSPVEIAVVNCYDTSCLVSLQHCTIREILTHITVSVVHGLHLRSRHHDNAASIQRHFTDSAFCGCAFVYVIKPKRTPKGLSGNTAKSLCYKFAGFLGSCYKMLHVLLLYRVLHSWKITIFS